MPNIKQLREERGWTQAQLAEKISASQPTVAHWEAGRYEPSLSSMIQLSRVFNIPLEELAKDVT